MKSLKRLGMLLTDLPYPPELSNVHNIFHNSMLMRYISDPSHVLSQEPLVLDPDLNYKKRPIQILDKREKELRNKKIPLVKILWRNHFVEEATWELENGMRNKYPELFGK